MRQVFCTSPWIPTEWVLAHGLLPRGIWSAMDCLPAPREGVCAFAQALAGWRAIHPDAVLVLATACDQMRRAADAVASRGSAFLFNLPATWQTPAARRLYHQEVARLGKFLEACGGRAPQDERLQACVAEAEERRARVRRFVSASSGKAAAEALARFAWDGSAPGLSAGSCAPHPEAVDRDLADTGGRHPEGMEITQPGVARHELPWASVSSTSYPERVASTQQAQGVPLALLGGPLLPAQWGIFDVIAAAGGCVVLNGTEPGERSLLGFAGTENDNLSGVRPSPGAATSKGARRSECANALMPSKVAAPGDGRTPERGTPLDLLADFYFDYLVDVFQRPNTRLYEWLGQGIKARGVRGLLLWAHVGCDLWRAEAASLREAFGLPVLLIEPPDARGCGPREQTRLAAFVESLRGAAPRSCRP